MRDHENNKFEHFQSNLDLLITFAAVLVAVTAYLVVRPADVIADLFDIKPYNPNQDAINEFRYTILLFPMLQLLLSVFIEVSNGKSLNQHFANSSHQFQFLFLCRAVLNL